MALSSRSAGGAALDLLVTQVPVDTARRKIWITFQIWGEPIFG